MSLEDLLGGLNPQATTYSMLQDPIYGSLFRGMQNGQPSRSGGGPSQGGLGRGMSPTGSNWEQIARQMAQRKYGWGPGQFKALDEIINAESGWNPKAVNPSSGAAGIPQLLPSAHPDVNIKQFMNDPLQQIRWMLSYVKGRYGTPQQALSFRQDAGWY